MRFRATVTSAGGYDVYLRWTSALNRPSSVPVDVTWSGGTDPISVNQRIDGGPWVLPGTRMAAANSNIDVLIANTGTSGYVIADALRVMSAGNQSRSNKVMAVLIGHDRKRSGLAPRCNGAVCASRVIAAQGRSYAWPQFHLNRTAAEVPAGGLDLVGRDERDRAHLANNRQRRSCMRKGHWVVFADHHERRGAGGAMPRLVLSLNHSFRE